MRFSIINITPLVCVCVTVAQEDEEVVAAFLEVRNIFGTLKLCLRNFLDCCELVSI